MKKESKKVSTTNAGYVAVVVLVALFVTTLVGCGRTSSTKDTSSADLTDEFNEPIIDVETSSIGIDSSRKDFLEQLVSGTFYIVHDGVYYPIFLDVVGHDSEKNMDDYVDETRLIYYTKNNDDNIPTFFPGDHLVYYSVDTFLDTITWERYLDKGYIIGLKELKRTSGGRYFIELDDDDAFPLFSDNDLSQISNLSVNQILIDKLGDIPIDDDTVEHGIITGTEKGHSYPLEIYTGTNYQYYNATADIHAFGAFENYASFDFETLQTNFWEIDVPQYFTTGYYRINNGGIFRLLRESSYSQKTDFNTPMLFLPEEDSRGIKRTYSENPNLNYFYTDVPGTLGYVDPDAEEQMQQASEETGNLDEKIKDIQQFKEANTKQYELWFPEGKQCSIKITSSSDETGGKASIVFDTGATDSLQYNRFDKVYETVINGKGNKGILTVSGFWKEYTIDLTNAEVYKGQDSQPQAPVDSDAVPADQQESQEQSGTDSGTEETDDSNIKKNDDTSTDVFGRSN